MADLIPFAGEPNTPPADPTALLALARAQLSWRGFFQEISAEQQEAEVQQQARGLAIAASDIGKSAARIGAALQVLSDEVDRFLDQWPDAAAAEADTLAAIVAAGLKPRLEWCNIGCGPEHFQHTSEELKIWQPMLRIMRERMEPCDGPDTTANKEEREVLQRKAA